MDGYAAGSVKRHPDFDTNGTIALRTVFEDDDLTGCTSWLVVSPGSGALYRTEGFVAEWPDAEGMTKLKADATVSP